MVRPAPIGLYWLTTVTSATAPASSGAEGCRIKVQQSPVETHQVFWGANPRARAHLTSFDIRAASAWATAEPSGVMR